MNERKQLKREATVAERLRETLIDKGLKAVDLCERTGISRGMMSRYINDLTEPSLSVVAKLAAALDVNDLWLYGFETSKYRLTEDEVLIYNMFVENIHKDPDLYDLYYPLMKMSSKDIRRILDVFACLGLLGKDEDHYPR